MFVAFFPTHGLKFASTQSKKDAMAFFTTNNCGVPPDWMWRVPAVYHDGARFLKRSNWKGSLEQFKIALSD